MAARNSILVFRGGGALNHLICVNRRVFLRNQMYGHIQIIVYSPYCNEILLSSTCFNKNRK